MLPRIYFRMLLARYTNELGDEREIGGRCNDQFVFGVLLEFSDGTSPGHNTLSKMRKRLILEAYV